MPGINLGSAYGQVVIDVSPAQQSIVGLADQLRNVGTTLSLGISAPLLAVGASAIKSAASFEQNMNQVQVIAQATGQQMAAMQQQALDLGAQTSFSANEAAQALLEMSKAGFTAEETMAAVPGVLDLAAAGGLGVAQAAEIAANVINAFNLEASQTSQIANMLAAAANSSSVEVTDLAQSFQMSAAVAAQFGLSAEDTAAALAMMGDAGLKGSDAGTSLKTMLMSLYAPTAAQAKAMENLGISMYDSSGAARPFADVMADLQQSLYGTTQATVTAGGRTAEQSAQMKKYAADIRSTQQALAEYQAGIRGINQSEQDKVVSVDRLQRKLAALQAEYNRLNGITGTTATVTRQFTEEERNAAMSALFGTDAIRAANILLPEFTDNYAASSEAIGQQGVASAVANARMKGLAGAIEYIKGSIDSFMTEALLPWLDSMSGIVRAAADAITWIGELPRPLLDAALAFAAVLAAAGPVMLAITGIGAVLGALLSPLGLVVLGVGALVAAFTADFGGIRTLVVAAGSQIVGDLESIGSAVQDGASFFGDLTDAVQDFRDTGDTTALKNIFDTIKDNLANLDPPSLSDVWKAAKLTITTLISSVDWSVPSEQFQAIKTAVVNAITGIDWGSLAADTLATLQEKAQALKSIIVGTVTGVSWGSMAADTVEALRVKAVALKDAVVGTVTGIDWATLAADKLEQLKAKLVTLKDSIVGAITSVDWGSFAADKLEQIKAKLAALKDGVVSAITGISWIPTADQVAQFVTALGILRRYVGNVIVNTGWAAIAADQLEQLKGKLTALKDTVVGAILATTWGSLAADKLEQIKAKIAALRDAVVGAVTGVDWGSLAANQVELLKGKIGQMKDAVVGAITGFNWTPDPAQTATIGEAIGKVKPIIDDIFGPNGIIATVQNSITSVLLVAGDKLAGVDGAQLAADMSPLILGLVGLATQLMAADMSTAAAQISLVTKLGTDVVTFLTNFGSGLDTEAIGVAVTGFAQSFVDKLTTSFTGADAKDAGVSVGGFARMIITKLGEALSPQAGENLGEAAGSAAGALATAAMNIITGIANELSKVNWTEFLSQLDAFVTGFLGGLSTSLSKADMLPTAKAMMDALAAAIRGAIGSFFPMGIFGTNDALKSQTGIDLSSDREKKNPGWLADFSKLFTTDPTWRQPVQDAIQNTPGWQGLVHDSVQNTPAWDSIVHSSIQTQPEWTKSPLDKIQSTPGWVDKIIEFLDSWNPFAKPESTTPGGGGGGGGGGFGGAGDPNLDYNSNKSAIGTAYAAGGLTTVGERGPELVTLPAGARVNTNGQSNRILDQVAGLMASMANPAPIAGEIHIHNEMDYQTFLYRVRRDLQQARRDW